MGMGACNKDDIVKSVAEAGFTHAIITLMFSEIITLPQR
jgi:hypothetical protein